MFVSARRIGSTPCKGLLRRDGTDPQASFEDVCDMQLVDALVIPSSLATHRREAPSVSQMTVSAPEGVAERLGRGDRATVHELYAEYGSRVLSYLSHLMRDRQTAEDVCQEVFVEVWRKGASYDPARGTPGAWIMTITRARAIDHMRKRVPEPRDTTEPGASGVERSDPAASVEALDEHWQMATLLDELPRDQAAVLRMRFHGDLSQTEIADALGIPLGTVKTRMARALGKLRSLMDESEAIR
jgi:RNA polymerase sigma-70 factor (ECF subfamily)